MDNKGKKFIFISSDEADKVEEDNNNNLDGSKKNISNNKFDMKKIYINFETRVIIMILFILILFATSCILILGSINFGKKKIVSYEEISSASYQVCLKENDYYTDSCIGEDMQYLSTLTDKILVNFKYNVVYPKKMDYTFNYHIVAVTKIFDQNNENNLLYKKEDILIDQTKLSNISDKFSLDKNLEIDYLKYNKYVMDYKNKYAPNAKASLEINFYLDNDRKISSVVVPLSEAAFNISKNSVKNENKTVEVNPNTWYTCNKYCLIIAIILMLISLILVYKTAKLVFKVVNNRSKYQKKLEQILREYDRIIVTARDGYQASVEKQVVKVSDFDELLDARDTLDVPIIYSKINDIKSEFIVEDINKIFKFTLKDTDL